jgi:copper(I)-binding protein
MPLIDSPLLRRAAIAAMLAVSSSLAQAQTAIAEPWVRATTPSQMATGAFMKITSRVDARLVEARSPVASVVEIHEMALENNVMRMRAITALPLPAGKTVELKPGGYHVMLMDLKQQLKEGDVVPVTLVLEVGGKRETVEIKAPVRPLTARGESKHKH